MAIDYQAIYSGGVDIGGRAWGRADDNIGLGYACLSGGNLDIKRGQVGEAYYRYSLNDYLAPTADLQYVREDHRMEESPEGFTYGFRLTLEF